MATRAMWRRWRGCLGNKYTSCSSIDRARFIGFHLSLFYVNKQVGPFLLLALDALKIGVELIE